jgi:hypothetical protein
MDPGVRRIAGWWGTLVVGLALFFIGVVGYIVLTKDLAWYETDLSSTREVWGDDLGTYVKVEGRVALNTTRDIIIVQEEVDKALWTTYDYTYTVAWVWIDDDEGDPLLVLFGLVTETKPGRHAGDYHRGDMICIGGTVASDGTGINRLTADFVAKYEEDTPARYAWLFVAGIFVGIVLILVFVLVRVFLKPRRRKAPDWRGT